jgi:hypothetical protein
VHDNTPFGTAPRPDVANRNLARARDFTIGKSPMVGRTSNLSNGTPQSRGFSKSDLRDASIDTKKLASVNRLPAQTLEISGR